jgi:putative FmdB family regulatory protein
VPLYDFAPRSGKCSLCKGRFEAFQRMGEKPLSSCPKCSKPCERLVSAAAITGRYSTSDSRVKELGMTKYKKAGDGVYEKTAGRGPNVIRKKD